MLPCLCWLDVDLLGPGSHEQAPGLGPCSAAQQSPFPWHSIMPMAPRQELSREQPARERGHRSVCSQSWGHVCRDIDPDQGHALIKGHPALGCGGVNWTEG